VDAAERELFARSVEGAMATIDVDTALVDVGWRDALAADARTAASILFDVQGRTNTTSSALDDVLLDAMGLDVDAAVILPPVGAWHPSTTGVATRALSTRAHAVVVTERDTRFVACVVPSADITTRPIAGLDPTLGLLTAELTGETGPIGPVSPVSSEELVDWDLVAAAGQRALAHELLGAGRKMLELAREHALAREQFGRPISQFQAVRHRLADVLVVLEAADALVEAAWDDGLPETARMAKGFAGRATRTAIRNCQQVLAGIGFTTEHPFHRYLARALVLDQLLGSGRTLTRELGREVLQRRALPPLVPL